jgi:hypothetical protein
MDAVNVFWVGPAIKPAGICGYKRVSPATARAANIHCDRGLAHKDNKTVRFAGLYGAYRDRTGDLRLAKLTWAVSSVSMRFGPFRATPVFMRV